MEPSDNIDKLRQIIRDIEDKYELLLDDYYMVKWENDRLRSQLKKIREIVDRKEPTQCTLPKN